jgi:uncharacterized protein (DUF58 family)
MVMPRIQKNVIFISLILLLVALIAGGKLPYQIFYTVAGAFIISYLWLLKVLSKISGYQRIRKNEFNVGDMIEIESFVENDSFLPVPYVEITDLSLAHIKGVFPKPVIASLIPFETEIVRNSLPLRYRGVYKIGPIDIKISDVFRAFYREIKVYSDVSFRVYPRVYEIKRFDLKSMQSYGTFAVKQRAFEDYSTVSDIRKYFPGDSVKKVHWKVSAKRANLYVKNYEMTGSASVCIFLNFNNNCYDNSIDLEERAIESTASLISYLLYNKVCIEMYVNSSQLYFVKGRDINEFNNFLNVLCEIKTNGTNNNAEIIEKRMRLIPRGSSIIIVTGSINYKEGLSYCGIKEMGYDVVLVYISDNTLENDVLSMINSAGVRLYLVNSDSNIKGVLESK